MQRALHVTDWDWITISIVLWVLLVQYFHSHPLLKVKTLLFSCLKKNDYLLAQAVAAHENYKKLKILFGIHTDGSIEWGVGVPTPIRKELEKLELRVRELETIKSGK